MSAVVAVPRPSRLEGQLQARLRPPSIGESLAREVLGRLGLALAGRPRNLGGGRRSRNVVVDTDHGRKVIKRYRDTWDAATVAYGHSILLRCQAQRLPAPRLVRAPDGATWVRLEGGGVYAVFDLLDGRGYSSSYLRRRDRLHLLERAGATLAGMHAGLQGFEPEGRHHMAFASLEGPRVRDAGWYATTVEELAGRADASDPAVARLVLEAPAAARAIGELEGALDGLPRTVIHGDYGLHNVVFRADDAVPIDFELSRLDLRVLDPVLFLARLLDAASSPDIEAWEALVAGYSRVAPLTADEREAFARVWRLQQLTSAVRNWQTSETTADPRSRTAAAVRCLDRAGWLDERPDVARRLLGATVGGEHAAR